MRIKYLANFNAAKIFQNLPSVKVIPIRERISASIREPAVSPNKVKDNPAVLFFSSRKFAKKISPENNKHRCIRYADKSPANSLKKKNTCARY